MLDFLRKRKRSWTIFLIVGVISFVFILYFGSSGLVEDPTLGPVAKVNGETISAAELETLVSRALRSNRSRQRIDELNLRIALLQDLIQTRLLLQEARRIGLEVTDEELTKTIAQNQVFQIDGQFNKALYLRILRANLVTAGQFEKERKNELLIDKLLDITRDSVHVSEAEVREMYQLEGEKVNLNFIRLARKDYVQKATVSAEELKGYYEQNQEELKEPLKVSVEYIAYPHPQFSSKIEVSEKDIEEYYNLHRDKKFHQSHAVRLRHIFFRIPPGKDPKEKETIRAKAEQVLGQAQAGKDFAELAKNNSDDFSASSGGDTGFLSRGQIQPAMEEAAFALKKGEISSLLESPSGLHIIKAVEFREEKTKTLQETENEIVRFI
jgi:peptidyl-prolyl cis-trans isomerase D